MNSSFTDLGLWNVFANTDLPSPQDSIRSILCEQHQSPGLSCSDEALLPLSIALIKTPGLRDLGHSAPYLHNGSKNSLEDTLNHYATQSDLARNGSIRNGAKQLQSIALNENDKQAIVQFLKSLNEDYN